MERMIQLAGQTFGADRLKKVLKVGCNAVWGRPADDGFACSIVFRACTLGIGSSH